MADARGVVACFNHRGEEVWVSSINGFAVGAASVGDINGDGVLGIDICLCVCVCVFPFYLKKF